MTTRLCSGGTFTHIENENASLRVNRPCPGNTTPLLSSKRRAFPRLPGTTAGFPRTIPGFPSAAAFGVPFFSSDSNSNTPVAPSGRSSCGPSGNLSAHASNSRSAAFAASATAISAAAVRARIPSGDVSCAHAMNAAVVHARINASSFTLYQPRQPTNSDQIVQVRRE